MSQFLFNDPYFYFACFSVSIAISGLAPISRSLILFDLCSHFNKT